MTTDHRVTFALANPIIKCLAYSGTRIGRKP